MPTSRLLRQIREQRHFGLSQVAESVGISPERLSQFEMGERSPSFNQLEKLAGAYGVPSYILGQGDLPNIPEPIADFRRAVPGPVRLSPKAMKRIWDVESAARLTRQLAAELRFEAAPLYSLSPEALSDKRAINDFREWFDEWFEERRRAFALTGTVDQVFLAGFRLFLESSGNLVNINDAQSAEYLGFFVNPENGVPSIFINRSITSKKSQLFTLAHEFAHATMGLAGVSNPYIANNQIERICNKFAAEFLLPSQVISRLVEGLPSIGRSDAHVLVQYISSQSLLSQHAAGIRLFETGYISQLQLTAWLSTRGNRISDKEEDPISPSAFGVPHARRVGEVGYLSTYLAKKAVERRLIDSVDVQNSLHLSEPLQKAAFALAERRLDAARAK